MVISLVVFIAIALDQYTKYLAELYLKGNRTYPLIDGVLHFTYTENTGAAFSTMKGMQSFLVIVTSIAMAVMFVYMVKLGEAGGKVFLRLGMAFVIAGGIGNLIDRLRFGYVIDFIDFRLINFAIFNVADAFITVGVIMLFIDTFFISKTFLK